MRIRSASAFLLILMQAVLVGGQPGGPRGNPHIVDDPPLAPAEQVKMMKLPPGFVMQLVAAEPKVKKPINIAFDALGRLWVTGSEEYPFPAPKNRPAKDKLVILEDFGPDGQARKATVFAEGLNIPIGVLPLPDCKSAIVFSIPNIWRLTDTDGDGKADKKDVLYTGYGYKDTHGMTGEFMWGVDGWIYCCHGYANASTVKSQKGDKVSMQSGNTYRIKPDGSKIEQFTWGQVNPFGLAFDEKGNLYSADCHTRPLYHLLKGAYYPSFGKPHDGLGFAPEMVAHDHGSTGIAGIAYSQADHFPPEFRDNIFIGNPITHRINRDKIEWRGSTPKGIEMPDLVVSKDRWFRPVDIKLGPDGALYVADFYNRIIGHYEVPLDHPLRDRERGRIWRIVYVGEDGKGRPKTYRPIPQRSVEEVVDALGDPNITVRTFAMNELVHKWSWRVIGETGRVFEKGTPLQITNLLWVWERAVGVSDESLDSALKNPESMMRLQATKIFGGRAELTEAQRQRLHHLFDDADASVRRAAAEALGAHPSVANVYRLSEPGRPIPAADAALVHTVRMALRDQFKDPETAKSIPRLAWKDGHGIAAVADVCLGSPTPEAAEFLLLYGLQGDLPPNLGQRRVQHVTRFGSDDVRASVLDNIKKWSAAKPALQAAGVRGLVQGTQERGAQLSSAERAWAEQVVVALLESRRALKDSIEMAGALRIAAAQTPLLGIVTNSKLAEAERRAAIAALLAIEPHKHVGPLAQLLVDDKEPIGLREQVAASLAGTNQKEAHAALIAALEKAPARLQTTIALGMAGSSQGGDKLLEAVAAGKASARLLQDTAIATKLRQARVPDVDTRLAKLTKSLPAADQRAQELMNLRRAGFVKVKADAREGASVFKKHCAACHQVKNEGSKIGPQLDGVGIRGLDRLLEDILDPNRNVDQAFRATTLELENGQFVTGLLLREEGKVLVMADNLGKEVRIPGEQVAERRVAQLSPMPANFAEQIPEKDFHDLVAYLLEQRVK
jgi:putative membrane-bound dehydrogenase-like protein